VVLRDFCTEKFETSDVEVDGTLPDGATTWERDTSATAAGDQRAKNQG
jgi:hypothetical protein